jgi:hypothetical protein
MPHGILTAPRGESPWLWFEPGSQISLAMIQDARGRSYGRGPVFGWRRWGARIPVGRMRAKVGLSNFEVWSLL